MILELHIESMIVEGVDALDSDLLRLAIERELARIVTERGIPRSWSAANGTIAVPGGAFDLSEAADIGHVAAHIAGVVYGGLQP